MDAAFSTPEDCGTCPGNLPRTYLPRVPPGGHNVSYGGGAPFAHRRAVKASTVRPPRVKLSRRGGSPPPPPPRRSEELRRILAASVPYSALPVCAPPPPPGTSPSPSGDARRPAADQRNLLRETPEPLEGFEKLYAAVNTTLGRLGGIELNEGWQRVGEWVESYRIDGAVESTVETCGMIVREVTHTPTVGSRNPEADLQLKHRVACAVAILEQALLLMIRTTPRIKPALRYAYHEICGAIFDAPIEEPDFLAAAELAAAPAEGEGGGGGGVAEGAAPPPPPPPALPTLLSRFDSPGLFRDNVSKAKRATQLVKTAATSRVRNLKLFCEKVVHMTNMSFLKIVFREWQQGVARAKRFQGWFDDEGDIPCGDQTFVTSAHAEVEAQLADSIEHVARLEAIEESLRGDVSALSSEAKFAKEKINALEKVRASQQQEISNLTETVKEMTKIIASIKGLSSQTERTCKDLEEANTVLSSCVSRSIDVVAGGDAELQQKESRWGSLAVRRKFSPQNLLEWIHDTVAVLGSSGDADVRQCGSWDAGPHLLNPLGGVIRVLAPAHLPEEKHAKLVTSHSFKKKADIFLRALESLGVHFDVSSEVLAQPVHTFKASPAVFLSIASLLYLRFTGGIAARCLKHAPFFTPAPVGISRDDASPSMTLVPQDTLISTDSTVDGDAGGIMDAPHCKAAAAMSRRCEDATDDGKAWLRSCLEGLVLCMQTLTRNLTHTEMSGEGGPLAEFTLTLDDAPFVESEGDLHAMNMMLNSNSEELANIFAYYASLVPGSGGALRIMEEPEFMKFVLDAKLLGKQVTRSDVLDLLTRVSHSRELNLHDWVVILPRLARLKYSSSPDGPVGKLKKLLNGCVLVNSKQMETDTFRKTIYSEKVQAVLKDYSVATTWLFKTYTDTGYPSFQTPVITKPSYDRMLHDMHVLDSSCTNYVAEEVYKRIQDPDDNSEDLIYHEFLECLVTLAAVKRPEPYIPLSQRVKHFIESWVLPLKKVKDSKSGRKPAVGRPKADREKEKDFPEEGKRGSTQ